MCSAFRSCLSVYFDLSSRGIAMLLRSVQTPSDEPVTATKVPRFLLQSLRRTRLDRRSAPTIGGRIATPAIFNCRTSERLKALVSLLTRRHRATEHASFAAVGFR